MLGSTVLEVAIGVTFCFASVALITSTLNEAIASMFKWRSRGLLEGIKVLLNDPNFSGLALKLYNHALVHPRGNGEVENEKQLANTPSYVPPSGFAVALVESLDSAPGNWEALGTKISEIPNKQLRTLLEGMYTRASGNIDKLHQDLADWFDQGMARLSGAYKRRSQLASFLLGFFVAAIFNIDAFFLFKTLWQQPQIAAPIGAEALQSAADAVDKLKQLPIGWDGRWTTFAQDLGGHAWDILVMITGWVITATAALFGAPFWFDVLQRLVQLRSSGPKPKP